MINGHVNEALEAVVVFEVIGADGERSAINAIIDTGFSEYVTLPLNIIQSCGFEWLETSKCQLADGSIVLIDVFEAGVIWNGAERKLPVHGAEGGPLIGNSLLRGSRLMIDFEPLGNLTIVPLE